MSRDGPPLYAADVVLIYRVGQLGDTIVSLPALRAIRRRHPGARLVLLTDVHPGKGFVSSWDILGPTRLFSEVYFYEPRPWHALRWGELLRLARRLRRLRPERVYYLAPRRSRAQDLRDRFFFRALCGIRRFEGAEAAVGSLAGPPSETLRLLRVAGGSASDIRFDVPIGDAERETVERLWRDSGLSAAGRVVALSPGGAWQAQRWPSSRYAALAARLLAAFADLRLLIIGDRVDLETARAIAHDVAAGGRVVDWTGRLSVLESAEALRRCALFIGNNAGPMHLAAAVGLRCVVPATGRDFPGVWDPYGEGHAVLRAPVPCGGCGLRTCEENALKCLTDISVQAVLAACLSSIEEVSKR